MNFFLKKSSKNGSKMPKSHDLESSLQVFLMKIFISSKISFQTDLRNSCSSICWKKISFLSSEFFYFGQWNFSQISRKFNIIAELQGRFTIFQAFKKYVHVYIFRKFRKKYFFWFCRQKIFTSGFPVNRKWKKFWPEVGPSDTAPLEKSNGTKIRLRRFLEKYLWLKPTALLSLR